MVTNIKTDVLQYIQNKYGFRKYALFGPIVPVTADMRLREDFDMVIEDAETMLTDIFERYNIEPDNFDLTNYFNGEYFMGIGDKEKKLKPLTISMIIESAKAGRWLYD